MKNKFKDTEHSLSRVTSSELKGFLSILVIMVGFTFFSPSMSAGGNLGIGLDMKGFITALLLGSAFLGLYTAALAYIGQQTGLTLDMLARYSFGVKGSYLPSALISFTQIGWFGVGVAMFAISISQLFQINTMLLIILTGAFMTLTAYKGIKGLAALSSVAVPLIFILGLYSVNYGVSSVGGFEKVFANSPEQPMSMAVALAIVIGSFISGGTSTPNFTRFSKDKNIAIWATVIAFFIGNGLMFIFGAVGGAVTGKPDIFDILIAQGLMIPAILVLGLNIWTTNDNALYTAGMGLANITKIPNKPLVLVAGGVGTIMAIWLYNNFVSYLAFLSGMIPPVGIVVILHYFMFRDAYKEDSMNQTDVKIPAILAVIAGSAVGIFVKWGVPPVNALVVAAIVYVISVKSMKESA